MTEDNEEINFSSVSDIQRKFRIGFVGARQIQIYILAQVEAERERIIKIIQDFKCSTRESNCCNCRFEIEESIRNKPINKGE